MPVCANKAPRPPLHGWDLKPKEAVRLQQELSGRVITHDAFGPVRTVAGVDVGFEDHNTVTRAAVAVLDFPRLTIRDRLLVRRPTRFPYIPGLLTFRELPAVLDAFAQLSMMPDLVIYDGQGIAHPRRFGIAAHLGVWLDLPVIGAAKSRLIGTHDPVPPERGAWCPLYDRGEIIGAALRTRAHTRPLYISVGHRISLETAIQYVLACTPRYRLPETTRAAHALASEAE
jgi:deoxyribonuclease V